MGEVLRDKVAVITGAGGGIGRAVALALAGEGAKVVVNDLGGAVDGTGESTTPADKVVEEIQRTWGSAVANYDSVATMEGGERIILAAVDNFDKIDILVTVAGILRDRMVFNMTEEEWDAVIDVHLKGTFTCVKYASILMRQQRSGRIITFSSESGLMGNSGQANYGAAKSGIAGLTKVVSRDLGKYGVTANSIVPRAATRMTLTEEVRKSLEIKKARGIEDEEGLEGLMDYQPEDVAPFVVFLASDAAANVNGQTFFVYGNTISLLSQPRPIKTIQKNGRWSLDELTELVPSTLAAELVNPAPPSSK